MDRCCKDEANHLIWSQLPRRAGLMADIVEDNSDAIESSQLHAYMHVDDESHAQQRPEKSDDYIKREQSDDVEEVCLGLSAVVDL